MTLLRGSHNFHFVMFKKDFIHISHTFQMLQFLNPKIPKRKNSIMLKGLNKGQKAMKVGTLKKYAYLGFAFQEIPMKQIESIFGVSYLCCSSRSDPVRFGAGASARPPPVCRWTNCCFFYLPPTASSGTSRSRKPRNELIMLTWSRSSRTATPLNNALSFGFVA